MPRKHMSAVFALLLAISLSFSALAQTSTPSTDELEATIAALETQVAANDPSPTATPKPTSTPASRYASPIQEFVDEDSATQCDHIGWNLDAKNIENLSEAQYKHYASCTDDGMLYAALCARNNDGTDNPFLGPAEGNEWLICYIIVGNLNAQFGLVSPFDFAIIDANNRRYETSFMAYAILEQSAALQVTTLSQGQNTQGAIVFEIPKTTTGTLRLEIGTTSFGLREPGVIILDPLLRG